MAGRFVTLPMYDPPELHQANDALWRAVAERLVAGGLSDVPEQLTRSDTLQALWRRDGLLLGQTCGYPLMTELAGRFTVVATPIYAAEGCEDAFHRSAVVVAASSPFESLKDLRGKRCAINDWGSNTGMNLLRALVAPLAEQGRFFGGVSVSGSHRQSLTFVAEGAADIAAIDCVTLTLLARIDPSLTARIRILAWSALSPALPFITAGDTDPATLGLLRAALDDVAADPALLLSGIRHLPPEIYDQVLQYERSAADQGYPRLA